MQGDQWRTVFEELIDGLKGGESYQRKMEGYVPMSKTRACYVTVKHE